MRQLKNQMKVLAKFQTLRLIHAGAQKKKAGLSYIFPLPSPGKSTTGAGEESEARFPKLLIALNHTSQDTPQFGAIGGFINSSPFPCGT